MICFYDTRALGLGDVGRCVALSLLYVSRALLAFFLVE